MDSQNENLMISKIKSQYDIKNHVAQKQDFNIIDEQLKLLVC